MTSFKHFAVVCTFFFAVCGIGLADEAQPKKTVTLMGLLSEWSYPDAEFGRAQSSDAAVAEISAIKSQAILTTLDSVEKVMDFYLKKLNVDKEGTNLDQKEGERITTERSILIQNVSGDETSSLFVISVNQKNASTTIVVSRAKEDKKTKIAWSSYNQLWP